jgi:hypothetical protein
MTQHTVHSPPTAEQIESVRNAIANDDLEDALRLLHEFVHHGKAPADLTRQLIECQRRLKQLDRERRQGIVTAEHASVNRALIAGQIQSLLESCRTSPSLPSSDDPDTVLSPPAQGTNLSEIWSRLAKLLRENYRVFHSFGPPARRLGVDRRLWRKQKAEVITPNNKSMGEILGKFRHLLPASAHAIADRMLNHLDAYELNREARVDYRRFTFPSDFSSLVQLGEAGYYRESYDRSGVRLWAAWTLGACPAQVLQAFMFGSILNDPRAAEDIDIDVLYVPNRGSPESYDQWLSRTKAEAKAMFGIPLHLTSFQSPEEETDFHKFLQRYMERHDNPRPFPLQPVENRL